MRDLLIAVAVALGVLAGWTGIADARSNVGSIKSDLVNEEAIRKLYDQFTAAWNRHDTEAISNMWALDGDHLEPDGQVAKGRDAVRRLLAQQHRTVFKNTTLTLTIYAVWFITGDVALVDGNYEIAGITTPDGHTLPPRKGHLTSILLNEQDRWWIAASRLMIPATLPWREKDAGAPGAPES
jgi:uncharacterized protein (TIGR02246 family)